MLREVFVIKNATVSDIELKDFGLIIPSGVTIDIGEFDNAITSDELYSYILTGDIIRVIDDYDISADNAYSSTSPYYLQDVIYRNVIMVSKTGSTFSSINSALDFITDNDSNNRYLIQVAPDLYEEHVTMKPYVSIMGVSSYARIQGKITINFSGSTSSTSLENIELRNFNDETVYINTNGSVIFKDVITKTYYTTLTGQSVKPVFLIENGTITIGGTSSSILYNTNIGTSQINTDTIYHVTGSNDIFLNVFNSTNQLITYEQNNIVSCVYNDNTNKNTTISIKESYDYNYLYHNNPSNTVIPIYNNGASNKTNMEFTEVIISAPNNTNGVKVISAYSKSATNDNPSIDLSYNTYEWDNTEINDSDVYLGAAVGTYDKINLISCTYKTSAQYIPTIYTTDGYNGKINYSVNSKEQSSTNTQYRIDSLILGYSVSGGTPMNKFLDEDTLSSNDPNAIASQRSIKYYVDNSGGSGVDWNTYNTYTGTTAPNTYALKSEAITGVTNLGNGDGIYNSIYGNNILLKSLSGGTNISIIDNGNELIINASGSAAAVWGTITGTLSDQIDLQNALDAKIDLSLYETFTGNTEIQITSLSTALSSEISSTDSDVTSLSSDISTESSTRLSADISLSSVLSSEISSTDSDVISLSSAISSTDSDVTSLSGALSTEIETTYNDITSLSSTVSTEITDRTNADTSLSTALSSEISSTNSDVTSLSGALSTEIETTYNDITSLSSSISTTDSDVTSLSGALSSEISTTDSDVTSLSSAVSTEASIRYSDDTSLSTALSSEISSTDLDVTSLSSAISSNDLDITSLSGALSSETSTRSSADTSLSTALSSEISSTDSDVISLSSVVSTESSTRSSADTSLSSALSSEISSTDSDVTSLNSAISTESSTRSSADTSLSIALSSEISSTDSDVTSLSSDISTEISDRSSADTSLSTALSSEISSTNSDVTSLSVETSTKIPKISGATQTNLALWNSDGTLYDSGVAIGSVTGGTGYYYYKDKTAHQSTTSILNVIYLSGSTGVLSEGTWSIDFNAIGGNSAPNKSVVVEFYIDGTLQGFHNQFKTNDANAVMSFVITKDLYLSGSNHTTEIKFRRSGGGTAFLEYGSVRARIVQ